MPLFLHLYCFLLFDFIAFCFICGLKLFAFCVLCVANAAEYVLAQIFPLLKNYLHKSERSFLMSGDLFCEELVHNFST